MNVHMNLDMAWTARRVAASAEPCAHRYKLLTAEKEKPERKKGYPKTKIDRERAQRKEGVSDVSGYGFRVSFSCLAIQSILPCN